MDDNETTTLYRSDRGIPLVFRWTEPYARVKPWLTCEHWCKWYSLFLVHPDDRVEVIGYGMLEPYALDESPYCDHVPNPVVVDRMAEARGWEVDDIAREVMYGRWQLHVMTCPA